MALQRPRLLVRGGDHVPDGDAPLGSGALHLREVHTQLLSLLLGGLRSVRLLLLTSSGLLGRLTCGLLSLLGGLPRSVLCLLGGSSGGFLRLSRCLLPLLGRLSGGVLRLLSRSSGGFLRLSGYLSGLIGRLPRGFLGLSRCLSGRVLHALRGLPDLIRDSSKRTAAALAFALLAAGETTGESSYSVLHLPGRLTRSVLYALRGLSGLVGDLSCLIGRLSCYLLGLPRRLSCGVLRLLGRSLCDLLHLLQGLLGGLVHRVLDARILGRLIHRTFELHVGVNHLLDLGLLVALGELLSVLLQLLAVVLGLALDPAQRLPVEVLGVLHGLLLHLLLKILSLICHLVSLLFIDFRFR